MKSWNMFQPGARFVAKMEGVLDMDQRPYDPDYPQVCLDEIQKVLRSTPRGVLPVASGKARREDHEYKRHGRCFVFLAVEPLQGFRHVWVSPQRTKLDVARVLKELVDEIYPAARKIDLVVDNLNIHHPACLYERFPPAEARLIAAKIEWHYTPEHTSWLNIAECELSVFRRQCLKSRLPDIETVTQKATAWQAERNEKQVGVDWYFTTEDDCIRLKRRYPFAKVQ